MNEAQAPKNPQHSRQLSDAEVLAYTSADPFAQTTSKPWEYTATSPFLRKVAIAWVEVRNIVGTRFYPWQVVYGLSFPVGQRMARLELPEFEFVPVWALQSGDKDTVIDNVRRFRDVEAKYMPQD